MSTNHHTPHPYGAPLTSTQLNGPLGELDAAIESVIASASGASTTFTATANAGTTGPFSVASTAEIAVGDVLFLGDAGGTHESVVVATVPSGTTFTTTGNLANTYAAGKPVSKSPVELVDARGAYTTLGERLTALPTIIRIVQITRPTVLYTPTAGIHALFVECVGGGGGGGAVATAASQSAAGGGGGGGAYSSAWLTGAAIKASYAVSVGAGGAGGAAGANNGTDGGDTTFDSPSVCTAKGGGGGAADTAAAGPRPGGPGVRGGLATAGVGDTLISGAPGQTGLVLSSTHAIAGAGGAGAGFGSGGGPQRSSAPTGGSTGTGLAAYQGAGGGGAGAILLNGAASQAGGTGADGLIRVWEF